MIVLGKTQINLSTRNVFVSGIPAVFTDKEFDLLALLASNEGKVFSKSELLDSLYPSWINRPEQKIIDVFVCKIRKKIARLADGENCLETVWGSGYVARSPEASALIAPSARRRPRNGGGKYGPDLAVTEMYLGNALGFIAKKVNDSELAKLGEDCAKYASVLVRCTTDAGRRNMKVSAQALIDRARETESPAFASLGVAYQAMAETDYKTASEYMAQARKLA